MDAVVQPLPTQMATASLGTNFDTPSGSGGGVPGIAGGFNPTPDMVTGMDAINPDPMAPGFTVSTISPTQGTAIAQYNAPEPATILMAAETPVSAASSAAAQESASDTDTNTNTMRSSSDPIWIRWIDTLSEWLRMLLSRE